MKYYLLLLVLAFKFSTVKAATDSVLFSKNGNYVLEKDTYYDQLNGCPCNYWKLYELNKNENTYTVVFENDSVYFLYYEEPGIRTGRVFKTVDKNKDTCTTLASIFKALSIAQYDTEYQFSPTSIKSPDTVAFKNKTLNTIYSDDDSTLYFDININIMLNNKELYNDTISTNVPKIDRHYKVYYSSDNNFYFVKGWYGFSATDPGTLTTSSSSVFLNRIGRRESQ